MLKIAYASCLGLSPVISAQFTLEMYVAASNRKKVTKTPYSWGSRSLNWRSSMLVPSERSSAVLVIISSKSVSICNCSHARRVNSGKITISYEVPLFDALVRG